MRPPELPEVIVAFGAANEVVAPELDEQDISSRGNDIELSLLFAAYSGFLAYFILATPMYSLSPASFAFHNISSPVAMKNIVSADALGLVLGVVTMPASFHGEFMAGLWSTVFLTTTIASGVVACNYLLAGAQPFLVLFFKLLTTIFAVWTFQAASFFTSVRHFLPVVLLTGSCSVLV